MAEDKLVSIGDMIVEIESALMSDTRTAKSKIVVMGPVNRRPEDAVDGGWVGVYVDAARYTPRSVGVGMGNWNSDVTFRLIVQQAHLSDPKEAFRLLSERVKGAIDVLLANRMLRGLSEDVPSIAINYATRDTDQTTLYFQAALVTISFIGRSTY